MKTIVLEIALLFSLLSPVSSLPPDSISQRDLWAALKEEIKSLTSEKKYKEALASLEGFEKQFPASPDLPEVRVEEAMILIVYQNLLEKGYPLLEKAEKEAQGIVLEKVLQLKKQCAPLITQKRLAKVDYLLRRSFAENIRFPASLEELPQKFNQLKREELKDGYGRDFHYELVSSGMFPDGNKMVPILYSLGEDGKEKTTDDLFPEKETGKTDKAAIFTLEQVYSENNRWLAEVSYFDSRLKQKSNKKIREGDFLGEYFVFGIRENGVIFLKDNQPLVIKRR